MSCYLCVLYVHDIDLPSPPPFSLVIARLPIRIDANGTNWDLSERLSARIMLLHHYSCTEQIIKNRGLWALDVSQFTCSSNLFSLDQRARFSHFRRMVL